MTSSEAMKKVETTIKARQIYEAAAIDGLWMSDADTGIRLFQGAVVENDGPGAGRSDDEGREPFMEVSGGRVLKKVLCLDRVPDQGAVLIHGEDITGSGYNHHLDLGVRGVRRPPAGHRCGPAARTRGTPGRRLRATRGAGQ